MIKLPPLHGLNPMEHTYIVTLCSGDNKRTILRLTSRDGKISHRELAEWLCANQQSSEDEIIRSHPPHPVTPGGEKGAE